MKSTEAPFSAAYLAVVLPAGPDPTTKTSTFSISSPLTVHHVLRDVQKSIPVYRIGEGIQDGTGRFGDLLGLRHASLHGVRPLDELQRTEDVLFQRILLLEDPAELRSDDRILHRIDGGKSGLALDEIRSDGLAGLLGIPDDIQGIIHDLERHPDPMGEGSDRLDELRVGSRYGGSRFRGGLEELGGLVPDDEHVIVLGDRGLMLEILLYELARAHGSGRVDDVVDDVGSGSGQEPEAHGEHEVAGDDGLARRILPVKSLPSAPDLALVVDIVVDEGGAMDDLEPGADAHGLVGVLSSACEVGQDADSRPETLAASPYDIETHVGQFGVVGLQIPHHEGLHLLEFFRDAGMPWLGHRHFIRVAYLMNAHRNGTPFIEGYSPASVAVRTADKRNGFGKRFGKGF